MKTKQTREAHLATAKYMRFYAGLRNTVDSNGIAFNEARNHQLRIQAAWHDRRAAEKLQDISGSTA